MGLKTFYNNHKKAVDVTLTILAIVIPIVIILLIRYFLNKNETPETPVEAGSSNNTNHKGGINNPGNLRASSVAWLGKTTQPGDTFESFDTIEHGIRAMYLNLMSYRKNGTDTIRTIISKWAPASENNTAAYINFVSQYVGVSPDDQLNISDYSKLITAMSKEEGNTVLAQSQVEQVVNNLA